MDLLRFITAGSVDDGKSTLIGRLLYDSKNILIDQLEALEKQTKNKADWRYRPGIANRWTACGKRAGNHHRCSLSLFHYTQTEIHHCRCAGPCAIHAQHDHRCFQCKPDHHTRRCRQGVVEQTRRHSIIASLLKIPHVVVAINKMDLVEYSQDVFNNIVIDYAEVAKSLDLKDVTYIPISALMGDNIVDRSTKMDWYDGKPLLEFLEEVKVADDINLPGSPLPGAIRDPSANRGSA